MSINKYNSQTGLLEPVTGTRTWIGTKVELTAARTAGTLPTDSLIIVTDDEDDTFTDQVTEDDPRAITSGGVYDALAIRPKVFIKSYKELIISNIFNKLRRAES